MRRDGPQQWFDLTVEINGTSYTGRYGVDRGRHPFVHVAYGFGQKSTHVGASSAETIARMLLRELIREEAKQEASC